MKFNKFLITLTLFSFLFFTFNVNAQNIDNKITILDFNNGLINSYNNYYIISSDNFLVIHNEKYISVNYYQYNNTIFSEKTFFKFIDLPVINNAKLVIKNESGIEIFNSTILKSNFSNIWNYGIGKYFNNDLIIAPISVIFGLLTAGTKLLYHFKRVK